jgi:hypothetical protein
MHPRLNDRGHRDLVNHGSEGRGSPLAEEEDSRSSSIHKHRFNTKDRLRRIRLETTKVCSSANETTDGSRYREDRSQHPASMTERQVFGP